MFEVIAKKSSTSRHKFTYHLTSTPSDCLSLCTSSNVLAFFLSWFSKGIATSKTRVCFHTPALRLDTNVKFCNLHSVQQTRSGLVVNLSQVSFVFGCLVNGTVCVCSLIMEPLTLALNSNFSEFQWFRGSIILKEKESEMCWPNFKQMRDFLHRSPWNVQNFAHCLWHLSLGSLKQQSSKTATTMFDTCTSDFTWVPRSTASRWGKLFLIISEGNIIVYTSHVNV